MIKVSYLSAGNMTVMGSLAYCQYLIHVDQNAIFRFLINFSFLNLMLGYQAKEPLRMVRMHA